jgi:protein involved in polysaccharide export with SLBB domain
LTCAMALVLAGSLTSFSTDGPVARAGSAPNNPADTNQSPPQSAEPHAILPEDLEAPEPADYQIVPCDLLSVVVGETPSGSIETTARVTETGNIAMPRIDAPLHVAGMTEDGIRTAIQKAYKGAGIPVATVEVVVTEARGRAFLILGDGVAVGQYALVSPNARLLDALAIGRIGRLDGMLARVIRHADAGHTARAVDVPLDRLIAGDAGTNVLVHPNDTLVVLDPKSAGADAATRAAASTTQPSPAMPDAIKPEDLEADKPSEYRVAASDLLKIDIHDLTGPGSVAQITQRVTATGNIHPPDLAAPVHVAGLTEIGIRDLLVKEYQDQHITDHPGVAVLMSEPRGRTFVVLGAAQTSGQFAIVVPTDFRLLDALALAGGPKSAATTVRIIREGDPMQRARVIDVPVDKLMAGEAGMNVRVRPGDAVVLLEGH